MAIGERIIVRRGTEAERQAAIAAGSILEGEPNFTTDEQKFYIGEVEISGLLKDQPGEFAGKIQVVLAQGQLEPTLPPFEWKPGLLELAPRFVKSGANQSGTYAFTLDLDRMDDQTRPATNGFDADGSLPYFDAWGRVLGAVEIDTPMRETTLVELKTEVESIVTALESIATNGMRGGTF